MRTQPFLWFLSLLLMSMPSQTHAQGRCRSGDCVNGFGSFWWDGGEQYVGNWLGGQMHGHGVFYWPNGRKYVGNWLEGSFEGEGTMFYEDGRIKSGYWKRNEFVALKRPTFALDAEHLRHGRAQLLQMLADRPAMRQPVREQDSLYQWTIRKLAGEDVQARIYWQPIATENFPIPSGVSAVHSYPTATQDGAIWVKPSDNPEELWAGLVYELFNIQNHRAFAQIEHEVLTAVCSKDEYVMRFARLEYNAACRTAQFFREVWQPHARTRRCTATPKLWFADIPPTFEQWIAQYTDRQGYPWHPYEGYYLELVRHATSRY